MSSHETPESVLSQLPGWEGASWRELEGCVTNSPYLVESGGRKAVLKIDAAPREAPFNSRHAEAKIQSLAAEAGLAARVLYVSDTVLMTEYIEGIVWSLDCLEEEANLDGLAAALKKLHSLPLTGRIFDTMGAAREYARTIGETEAERVEECLRKIDAGPRPHNLCCCHNDLVVANIINTPETRFLDWEYASDNDPFFDLATIVAHHKMTQEQSDYFLDAYFDGDGARWREQLLRQADVYEALLWLWSAALSQREVQSG
jgi:thiamine kinase-like enzyme